MLAYMCTVGCYRFPAAKYQIWQIERSEKASLIITSIVVLQHEFRKQLLSLSCTDLEKR